MTSPGALGVHTTAQPFIEVKFASSPRTNAAPASAPPHTDNKMNLPDSSAHGTQTDTVSPRAIVPEHESPLILPPAAGHYADIDPVPGAATRCAFPIRRVPPPDAGFVGRRGGARRGLIYSPAGPEPDFVRFRQTAHASPISMHVHPSSPMLYYTAGPSSAAPASNVELALRLRTFSSRKIVELGARRASRDVGRNTVSPQSPEQGLVGIAAATGSDGRGLAPRAQGSQT